MVESVTDKSSGLWYPRDMVRFACEFEKLACIRRQDVGINEQDFLALLCQTYAQIDRRGGFADTAFLIG